MHTASKTAIFEILSNDFNPQVFSAEQSIFAEGQVGEER